MRAWLRIVILGDVLLIEKQFNTALIKIIAGFSPSNVSITSANLYCGVSFLLGMLLDEIRTHNTFALKTHIIDTTVTLAI